MTSLQTPVLRSGARIGQRFLSRAQSTTARSKAKKNAKSTVDKKVPDFGLTSFHRRVRDFAKGFSVREIIPQEGDLSERKPICPQIKDKLFKAGFTYTHVPKKYGGVHEGRFGFGFLNTGLMLEGIAFGCADYFTTLGANALTQLMILYGGSERQKFEFLGRLAQEPSFSTMSLHEPENRDSRVPQLHAEKHGEFYILNGEKRFLSNTSECSYICALGKTSDGLLATESYSGFLLETNTPGISVAKQPHDLNDTKLLQFNDVMVHEKDALGYEGEGFELLGEALHCNNTIVGFGGSGMKERIYTEVRDELLDESEGELTASEKSDAEDLFKAMRSEIETLRDMTYRAAWRTDNTL